MLNCSHKEASYLDVTTLVSVFDEKGRQSNASPESIVRRAQRKLTHANEQRREMATLDAKVQAQLAKYSKATPPTATEDSATVLQAALANVIAAKTDRASAPRSGTPAAGLEATSTDVAGTPAAGMDVTSTDVLTSTSVESVLSKTDRASAPRSGTPAAGLDVTGASSPSEAARMLDLIREVSDGGVQNSISELKNIRSGHVTSNVDMLSGEPLQMTTERTAKWAPDMFAVSEVLPSASVPAERTEASPKYTSIDVGRLLAPSPSEMALRITAIEQKLRSR